jgi:hypothetical protein
MEPPIPTGLIYFVTGTACRNTGVKCGGDNGIWPVIALEMKTGKLRWHYRAIRHDIWETDLSIPPSCRHAVPGGREGRGGMRGDGYLFLLDRAANRRRFGVPCRRTRQSRRRSCSRFPSGPTGCCRIAASGGTRVRRRGSRSAASSRRPRSRRRICSRRFSGCAYPPWRIVRRPGISM